MSLASVLTRLDETKDKIKTAIVAKGVTVGATDTFENDYATRISEIPSGGGEEQKEWLVRFLDYDGTILKEEWLDTGETATPPATPTHSGLTFYGWNTTTGYTNIEFGADIGATYRIDDGKTHMFMRVNLTTGLSFTLNIGKLDTGTTTVDWGDGTTTELVTTGNNITPHTYAVAGDYEITIWQSSGTDSITTYKLGGGNGSTPFLTTNTEQAAALEEIWSWHSFNYTALINSYGLLALLIAVPPEGFVSDIYLSVGAFSGTKRLKAAVIPRHAIGMSSECFKTSGIEYVSFSEVFVSLGTSVFASCYFLKRLSFIDNPAKASNTGYYSLLACASLIANCYQLNELNLPTRYLEKIYSSFFSNCYSIKKIHGVAFIQYGSEFGSSGLEEIVMNGDINSSFNYATKIKKIDIKDISSINGSTPFIECNNLEQIIIRPLRVVTLGSSTAFRYCNPEVKVYVPDAYVDSYKAATNWSIYALFIHPLSEIE